MEEKGKECYSKFKDLTNHEDEVINQRFNQFFIGNSFLFAGFITSFFNNISNTEIEFQLNLIRISTTVIAFFITLSYYIFFMIPGIKAFDIWHKNKLKLENIYFDKEKCTKECKIMFDCQCEEELRNDHRELRLPFGIGIHVVFHLILILWIIFFVCALL